MDMAAPAHEQRLFFTTGRRQGEGVDAIESRALRPALLARYRDLARLRYDYPLVLVASGAAAGKVRSLSSVIDEVLSEVAPRGLEGERLRKHVLRLEREIRALCGAGARGLLSELWAAAADRLAVPDDPSAVDVLAHISSKLKLDGEIVDCDASTAARLAVHLWQAAQQRKGRAFHATVERLVVRLSDILRAAFLHSEAGQRPDSLRAALGGPHRDAFDFEMMSRLVGRTMPKDELPPQRRARIERTLEVLKAQRFFTDPNGSEVRDNAEAFDFRFGTCVAAAEAFRSRLPKLAEVVKAISIAELEAEGRYADTIHDAFFRHFDADSLTADDLALFPDYLVCIPADENDAPGNAGLMDVLSAGLPVKVLVETTDLVEDAAVGTGHFAFGVRSMRLANTATALGGVFVVQAASSHLYAVRERLERAFAHRGAALVSVYAGAGMPSGALAPYLTAAAAMESRAFPAFTYDPYAGDNQAARFSLVDNPQPEADWPVATLEYADESQQRVVEETAFTIADFVLCDRRYAAHFARVPRERWNDAMIPADEWLARDGKARQDVIPYVLAVDADDLLHRLIADARLMQVAARCRTFWHRLQEQGGIHNSHAEILLAREKARWDEARAQEREAAFAASGGATAVGEAPSSTPAAAPAAASAAVEPAPPEHDPDEAWIETARCPSCNECQTINDRMFRYNENQQAYIADLSAGTYRQLVEAAEACQVAIIHPGRPRDPDEPGLAELLERARAFL
jgi:hypothetical protein